MAPTYSSIAESAMASHESAKKSAERVLLLAQATRNPSSAKLLFELAEELLAVAKETLELYRDARCSAL